MTMYGRISKREERSRHVCDAGSTWVGSADVTSEIIDSWILYTTCNPACNFRIISGKLAENLSLLFIY